MIRIIDIQHTDTLPMKPRDAEIGITIDFERGKSNPTEVFSAMSELLSAFHEFDELLLDSIDPQLEPIMVLEDVEANSITSWVKNKIEKIDDGALKEFDIKQQVGAYAVKAKYRILKYLDEKEDENERERLNTLQKDLYKLSQDNAVGQFPLPSKIPLRQLMPPMTKIQSAKQRLNNGEEVFVKSNEGDYALDVNEQKNPADSIPETVEGKSNGDMEMTLLLRKPDMLGNALWDFRHGKTTIPAHILDEDWLSKYRTGAEVVIPGSSLSCTVSYEYEYDKSGALLSAKHDVTKVHRVNPPDTNTQGDLLDE